MESSSAGIDIVSIARMGQAWKRELFLKRVFTGPELDYAGSRRRPEKHLAGRFAAKEAVVKALSRGILSGISMKDIEVVNGVDGRPVVRLGPVAAEAAKGRPVHLSISYTEEFAFAFVMIGRRPRRARASGA
ncbi:MAG: holo-[acyl-carrier-protein] synthase [Deltaproteobacteria bacterium RBG_19FT_COMBO_56_10]|nr:MAG: holo-[acyl-carrier-protein] synthase [Deltaproteobacteria bacterium RBG_19FT_COMBO_56_10]